MLSSCSFLEDGFHPVVGQELLHHLSSAKSATEKSQRCSQRAPHRAVIGARLPRRDRERSAASRERHSGTAPRNLLLLRSAMHFPNGLRKAPLLAGPEAAPGEFEWLLGRSRSGLQCLQAKLTSHLPSSHDSHPQSLLLPATSCPAPRGSMLAKPPRSISAAMSTDGTRGVASQKLGAAPSCARLGAPGVSEQFRALRYTFRPVRWLPTAWRFGFGAPQNTRTRPRLPRQHRALACCALHGCTVRKWTGFPVLPLRLRQAASLDPPV